MESVLVFLGSGVSVPSRIPGVVELTRRLLDDPYHRTTVENYSPGDAASLVADWYSARPLQQFLQYLAAYTKRFLNRKRDPGDDPIEPNYEDLYYLCDQVHDDLLGAGINPAVHEFTRCVGEGASDIIGSHPDESKRDLLTFVQESRLFIPSVVWHALDRREVEPVGLGLLVDIARSAEIGEVSVVTLNHDTLVERLFTQEGVAFEDGFGEADGSVRWYEPDRLFGEEAGVRLIKPHGSVDWYRFRPNPTASVPGEPDRYGIHVGRDIYHSTNARGTDLLDLNTVPLFLSGTGKELLYNSGIYGDMYDAFLHALRSTDTVVMSGYGWNDAGISSRLYTWMDRDPNRRLLILHENATGLWLDSRAGGSIPKYADRGQVLSISKWLQNVEMDEVLRSLASSR